MSIIDKLIHINFHIRNEILRKIQCQTRIISYMLKIKTSIATKMDKSMKFIGFKIKKRIKKSK